MNRLSLRPRLWLLAFCIGAAGLILVSRFSAHEGAATTPTQSANPEEQFAKIIDRAEHALCREDSQFRDKYRALFEEKEVRHTSSHLTPLEGFCKVRIVDTKGARGHTKGTHGHNHESVFTFHYEYDAGAAAWRLDDLHTVVSGRRGGAVPEDLKNVFLP